jgi:hypothetical protein
MHRPRRLSVVIVGAAISLAALAGCAQQPTAVQPAKQQVDQQTQQTQASVDATLNAIQDKVTQVAKTAGDLEARVNGLQVNSDIQGIQRQLTDAIGAAGDKKKAAIDKVSASFDSLIAKVDAAAAKLPPGGPVQTQLTTFSQQLKDVQTSLATAAASVSASPTP